MTNCEAANQMFFWCTNDDVMWCQDYVSDWSPEETVQRMQQGKVTHSIFGITVSGGFSGEVVLQCNISVYKYSEQPPGEGTNLICTVCVSGCVFVLCMPQVVSLEKFRSLQDKLLLLDFSVSAHDGNVITAVTLFKIWSTTIFRNTNFIKHNWQHNMFFLSGFNLFKEDSE